MISFLLCIGASWRCAFIKNRLKYNCSNLIIQSLRVTSQIILNVQSQFPLRFTYRRSGLDRKLRPSTLVIISREFTRSQQDLLCISVPTWKSYGNKQPASKALTEGVGFVELLSIKDDRWTWTEWFYFTALSKSKVRFRPWSVILFFYEFMSFFLFLIDG